MPVNETTKWEATLSPSPTRRKRIMRIASTCTDVKKDLPLAALLASAAPLSPSGRKTQLPSSKSLDDESLQDSPPKLPMVSQSPRWVYKDQPFGMLPISVQQKFADEINPLTCDDSIENWDLVVKLLESKCSAANICSRVALSIAAEVEDARVKAREVFSDTLTKRSSDEELLSPSPREIDLESPSSYSSNVA